MSDVADAEADRRITAAYTEQIELNFKAFTHLNLLFPATARARAGKYK